MESVAELVDMKPNSVTVRLPSVRQNLRKLPGRSGMVTPNTASRCSPISARSEMCRSRSKLTLAPLTTATRLLPDTAFSAQYFFIPATASAPDGSAMERVSSNRSLIAAQISSVLTVTV